MTRRVVITGLGTVNPLANNMGDTWDKLLNGESGIGPITRFRTDLYGGFKTTIAGEVTGLNALDYLEPKAVDRMDRFSLYAVISAMQALKDSGIDINKIDPDRFGTLIGTGVGGIDTTTEEQTSLLDEQKGTRRTSALAVAKLMPNAGAGNTSINLGAKGMNVGAVSACSAGGDALGIALGAILLGWADIMLAGGTEAAINPLSVSGFNKARALATKYNDRPSEASRPFDLDRDGFVISEGGAVLVLELLEHALARKASIYAELVGYASRGEAHHLTAPSEDGDGAYRAMKAALADAGVNLQDVDYINAHGTSTDLNDRIETHAIKRLFGDGAKKIPVSSTKSMTGHMVGAAGAIEAAITALVVQNGVIPPTINYTTPDPECDLDYVPNQARDQRVDVAISNVFGFGGHNTTLVIKRWDGR